MGRTVYVVARDHPELYAYLRDRFTSDGESEVEVILDRRVVTRRRLSVPYAPERRREDRRSRPHVDTELQVRSHSVITFPDSAAR
jgi:hypothetical protein